MLNHTNPEFNRQDTSQQNGEGPHGAGSNGAKQNRERPAPYVNPPSPPPPSRIQVERSRKSFEVNSYRSLRGARTRQDFTDRITDILAPMGFDAFSFTYLTAIPAMLFSNLPGDLTTACHKGGFIKDDYAISYGLSSSQPLLRSIIEDYMNAAPIETRDMARNRTLSNLYHAHGFYDFYLVPVISGEDRFLFTVTSRTEDICALYDALTTHETLLHLLGKIILQTAGIKFKKTIERAKSPRPIVTTTKPRKLLQIIAREDLTLAETADRLCISLHTADKHSATIREALGARTISGAIYIALRDGIIDFN